MSDSVFKTPEPIPQYYYNLFLYNEKNVESNTSEAGESPENPLIIPKGKYRIVLMINQDPKHGKPKTWSVKLPPKVHLRSGDKPEMVQDVGKLHGLRVGIQGENQEDDMKPLDVNVPDDPLQVFVDTQLSKGPAKVVIIGIVRLILSHKNGRLEDVQDEPEVSLNYFLKVE